MSEQNENVFVYLLSLSWVRIQTLSKGQGERKWG